MDANTGMGYALLILRIKDENGRAEIDGMARLQKMMYMFSKIHPKLDYGFVPHRYGMYSDRLDDILKGMENQGLVYVDSAMGHEYGSGMIHLTEKGRQAADRFVGDVDAVETLRVIKFDLNPLTYRQFMVLAYTQFPEMLEKSELVNRYEKWRKKAAVSMYRDGRVMFSLARRMSGLDAAEFGEASVQDSAEWT